MTERVVGRPFEKGRSGNPGGRPKQVPEVIRLARLETEASIRKLAQIRDYGESEAAVVAASVALLDRGWGKPAQHMTFGDEENEPTRADDTERLLQLGRKILAARAGDGMDEAVPDEPAQVVH
jgi:Family of unknown function (DUF5681)